MSIGHCIPPLGGAFSLITANPAGFSLDHVAFFDASTLSLKSQTRPDDKPYDGVDTGPQGVNYGGYSLTTSRQVGVGYVKDMHFYDSDGAEVGEFRNVGPYMVTQFGILMEHRPRTDAIPEERRPGVFYFDFRNKTLVGPIAPYSDFGDSSFNTWSQASRYTYGDLILLRGTSTSEGQYVSIVDLGSGQVVFDLDRTKVAGLRLKEAFLGDRYLYLTKSDQRSVVDYQTKEEVATDWALRPVFKLAEGWALLRVGHESENHSLMASGICINVYWTTCTRGQSVHPIANEYIAAGVGGGAYTGPWY